MIFSRNDLNPQDIWNVEALYKTLDAWNLDLKSLQKKDQKNAQFPELIHFKDSLKEPEKAAAFLSLYFETDRKISKLYTYAHLRQDEDLGNDIYKKNFGLISGVAHEFQKETSWVEPELLSLPEKDFQKLLSNPLLKEYHFFLSKIGKMRPHTLSAEMEQLIALSSKALSTSYRAFGALNNADLTFEPAVDSKGEKYPLTNGSYLSLMRKSDRALRKSAFQNLHKGFEAHLNTLCELLQGQVENHLFQTKARHFDSCMQAALFPHNVEPVVYENLIKAVRKALPIMHQYIALRKELLNLSELHYYDLIVPLIEESDLSMNYPDACKAVIASVAPLGNQYQQDIANGLTVERWVDVYETPRKRSGAYSSGCYDSMPYILLNYQGTLNDVLTLAHEAGHSMHSLLSRRHQSYIYSHYPIFVAEVASTFNEQLLLNHLKSKAQSKKEKALLINYEIEGIRGTIFRQTMFAEFELQIHKWAEEKIPLTPTLLKEYYLKLNQEYYGSDLVLDPELAAEWARIPHFYYNFYVYQYATGLSAALSLFEQTTKNPASVKQYLEFLSSGGSLYPLDLLEKAGVNMRSTKPIEAAMHRFEILIKELKECITTPITL